MYLIVIRFRLVLFDEVLVYFQCLFIFEIDCWDVYYVMNNGLYDFVLFDVWGIDMVKKGYIDGVVFLFYVNINEVVLSDYVDDMVFVVYCVGFYCNVIEKVVIKLVWFG